MKATKITALIAAFMALAVIFTATFTSPKIMALDDLSAVITYDGNGGKTNNDETQYTDDDLVIDENKFVYDGYEFDGWYNNSDCDGETFTVGSELQVSVTLYAKWRVTEASLNTDSDDTSTDSTEDTSTDSSVDSDDTNTDSSLASDTDDGMIYATFFGNGGLTTDSEDSVKTGPFKPFTSAEAQDGDKIPVIENPFVNDGYIFVGWNTKADGTGTSLVPGKQTMGKKDLSFYAIWEKSDGVYVIYNGNGGKTTDNEETVKDGPYKPCTDNKSKDGDAISVADNTFVREGYTFNGWNTKADGSGTALSVGRSFMITKDYTLYAIWVENLESNDTNTDSEDYGDGEYQVTYLLDGTEEGEKLIGGRYDEGEKVVTLDFEGEAPEGKVFAYWVAVGDTTERPFKAGQEFDMPAGHVLFKPVFKAPSEITSSDSDSDTGTDSVTDSDKKDGFFVTYSANIGTDSEATFTDGPYTYRDVVVAKANTFTKDGYTFACWNTAADGTGTDVMINDKFYMPSNGVTLYAKWIVAGTSYTPNTNGGSAFSGSVKTGVDNTIVYIAYAVLAMSVMTLIVCSLKKKREN